MGAKVKTQEQKEQEIYALYDKLKLAENKQEIKRLLKKIAQLKSH